MNKTESGEGILIFILIVGIIWLWNNNSHQKTVIANLRDTVENCSQTIDEANNNINDLNYQIDDAQNEAWDDYDSMGYALENLTDGDTVDNDCYDTSDQ